MSEIVLGVLEVLEAEARELRRGILRLHVRLCLLALSALLLVGGVGWTLWALHSLLALLLPLPWAALCAGLFALAAGGILLWELGRNTR